MSILPTNLSSTSANADAPVVYPTSDGRPMGETDLHRQVMIDLIETLEDFYRGKHVYVSGNILLFYEEGNKRRHVSPDVLVTKELEMRPREYYLLWLEGLPPNFVIEVTSSSTRKEDIRDKMHLYRDVIRVNEYFLFDPRGDYLKPNLQGHRLTDGNYVAIESVNGRLPSQETGLHLERSGNRLRLYDPATGQWLPTRAESLQQAEVERQQAEQRAADAEAEVKRLRAELDLLRKRPDGSM